ncbi:enoyl-CoA hydratase/isomerase family protein [Gordonia sp. PDNC005]|uniref:enoyl-CoA hydratase-related protein n=1 Tax=unclassified Gordonia (in: high G+C Gram-positive bacteria) TaxID=2657482 RepID=UPI001964C9D3|nr:enoyl-CoA hydratase-related protein [Gordonia sp. PDNC005]QRY61183.1 enoyl-CoA hydratase/isomerase family protein [Gordonia sp. PDNC005]
MATISTDGPIWTLDLGTDENRFSPDWLASVQAALDELEASDDPAALVTIGSGKFFSNGLDLDWLMGHSDQHQAYVDSVQALFVRVLTLPVPTVAAVNGHAFGAGAMLAMAHDYRVMRSDRGFFCFPEVDIRIPFTPGMNDLITAKLTPQTALRSMTSGHRYGGAEAEGAGIVDTTTTLDDLHNTAAGIVRGLAGKDRTTLGAIKARLFEDVVASLTGDTDGSK